MLVLVFVLFRCCWFCWLSCGWFCGWWCCWWWWLSWTVVDTVVVAVLQDGFESFCFGCCCASSACSCALRRFLWRGTRRSRRRKGVVGDCCFCSLTTNSASDWHGESGELASWKNFVIVTDSEGIMAAAGMQGWDDGCRVSQLWAAMYDRTNELVWEVNCCCPLLVDAFAGDVNCWSSEEWHITSWMCCATRWDDDFLWWRNIKLEPAATLIIFKKSLSCKCSFNFHNQVFPFAKADNRVISEKRLSNTPDREK